MDTGVFIPLLIVVTVLLRIFLRSVVLVTFLSRPLGYSSSGLSGTSARYPVTPVP
jgi:hypothetical protein